MGLQIGIVGLPNSGKTTLFNALTGAGAQVAPYPFTTIEPNVGVVTVPDERLDKIAALVHPEKVVHATVEFVDIAGLVKGASQGEGLGNQFLGHIRNTDAICMVLRCFQAPDVPYAGEKIDPLAEKEILDLELALADLETLERSLEKVQAMARSGHKEYETELALIERVQKRLGRGESVWSQKFSEEEKSLLQPLNLLSAKPRLYVANVEEDDLPTGGQLAKAVEEISLGEKAQAVVLSAQTEAELVRWPLAEAQAYLQALGLSSLGRDRLILAAYHLLDLISFFTIVGGKEAHAWTVVRGTTAPQAAGKVHSDMERGFIRAEVITWSDLSAHGSLAAAREKGVIHFGGRDYVVQDGDVVQFRFQV